MIDFRYFLVTIAAVFLALATGIVLGTGPLGQEDRSRAGSGASDSSELSERLTRTRQRAAYAEQVATSVGAKTVADRLDGRSVALVSLPGADGGTVRSLGEAIRDAGGRVPQTVQLTEKWADPQQRQFLENLSARLVPQGVTMPEGDVYDRAGTLLARAVLGPTDGSSSGAGSGVPSASDSADRSTPRAGTGDDGGRSGSDDPAVRILSAYDEGGLTTSNGEPQPADLAVVVAPREPKNETTASERPWTSLVRALDRAGEGTVVVGPPDSAREGGALAAVRADAATAAAVSTVDTADRASGRLAVVLALAEQLDSEAGHYGAVGAVDGALPG